MPSNNTGIIVGYLAGRFPGRIGHLFSPKGLQRTHPWLPFALDNGKFACYQSNKEWDELEYRNMLGEVSWLERLKPTQARQNVGQKPMWALAPDEVANKAKTIELYKKWESVIRDYNWKVAFAVQDGMTKDDVPSSADVIFVGGSYEWKWETYRMWCGEFPHVHIGRVNRAHRLYDCHFAGAKSIDGTGWLKGRSEMRIGLEDYMRNTAEHECAECKLRQLEEQARRPQNHDRADSQNAQDESNDDNIHD